jgi:hypothetical protein
VGAVADATAKLAEANVNITAATATGAGSGRYGMIRSRPMSRGN